MCLNYFIKSEVSLGEDLICSWRKCELKQWKQWEQTSYRCASFLFVVYLDYYRVPQVYFQ